MTQDELTALLRGIAPSIRAFVAEGLAAKADKGDVEQRLDALAKRLDVIEGLVIERIDALP